MARKGAFCDPPTPPPTGREGNYTSAASTRASQTHPLHAVTVADLQLLLGLLEAAVLLVVSGGLEVNVHVVGGLGRGGHHCGGRGSHMAITLSVTWH